MDWFVVATKPNCEKTAELNLRQQGFKVFLPLIEKTRRHARRVEKVFRPFFPSYLFVQFDAAIMSWHSINGTIGVRHILTNNGRPQPIAENFVETLFCKLNELGVINEHEQYFSVGSKVEVATGVMKGHLATILSADSSGRVNILLSMMGRDIISTISAKNLEKAN